MKPSPRQLQDRVLLVGALVALTTAATLVGYLEHHADELQRQQNQVIIQQICERTATVLAGRIRHLLDVAVLETIEGIGHQKITDNDVPRIASAYANGLKRHPYVDQFFLWSANSSQTSPDEVMFYSRGVTKAAHEVPVFGRSGEPLGAFVVQPTLGREIMRLARAVQGPRTFLVIDRTVDGTPYEIVVHLMWRDDRRLELFSIIGYTVNLVKVDGSLLHRLLDHDLCPFLKPDPHSPRLTVALRDEAGQIRYGDASPPGAPSATTPIDMLFFPGEPLTPWLAGRLTPRQWQLTVSTAESMTARRLIGGWVMGAVVLLILIAVVCGITVDRQSRQLSQMQSDFVANASHQLKTPLSLLSAAIETLCLGRVPPEKMKQYLDILSSQTGRMTALVERILHFSRLEADPSTYRMEAVNLVPLVEAVVERFRIDARHQVPITFDSSTPSIMVRADASALEQALVNLVENAVKYGDERNHVHVRVDRTDDQAAISVRDSGFGIHKNDLPYVFDKFYRGKTGDDGRSGFGLGLALVQSIARGHGGRARVSTEYQHGSEFSILLPALSKDATYGVSDPGDRRRTGDAAHAAGQPRV